MGFDACFDVSDCSSSDLTGDVVVVPIRSACLEEVCKGEVKREDTVPEVTEVGVHRMVSVGDVDGGPSGGVGGVGNHGVQGRKSSSISKFRELQRTI